MNTSKREYVSESFCESRSLIFYKVYYNWSSISVHNLDDICTVPGIQYRSQKSSD